MRVGINYAWKNYAWDFGEPPHKASGAAWGPRAAWKPTLDAELAEWKSLGLFAVRWFLLGDGTTYGVGAQAPHLDPGSGQWRFDEIPHLSVAFLEDFEALLVACQRAGILLIPSLLDFHFGFPGLPVPGSTVVKQGRSDVLYDPHKRALFLSRVLAPLLELCRRYREVIHAFELMNEPEWCTQQPGLSAELLDPRKRLPRTAVQAYLVEGARLIHEAGLRSSCGFAHHHSLAEWDSPKLGLTLHQFHYYADDCGRPMPLPAHTYDARWPVIVGEIATARFRPWPELGPQQDLHDRLVWAAGKGYPEIFLWSANREEEHAVPPVVDWSEKNRELVRRFTSGH